MIDRQNFVDKSVESLEFISGKEWNIWTRIHMLLKWVNQFKGIT